MSGDRRTTLQRKAEAKREGDGDVTIASIWCVLYLLMVCGTLFGNEIGPISLLALFIALVTGCVVRATWMRRASTSVMKAGLLGLAVAFLSISGAHASPITYAVSLLDLPAGNNVFANGKALPTTPIQATLPLFASGLGALGLLGWRRKKKASTVTCPCKRLFFIGCNMTIDKRRRLRGIIHVGGEVIRGLVMKKSPSCLSAANMTLMYRSAMAGACVVAVSIALPSSARADSFFGYERALISGYADTCGITCPGLGTTSVTASDGSNVAHASATATNGPALSASASGGGALSADATAEIDYSFEWLDPTPGAGKIPTLVALILHTAAFADANDPNSSATAIAAFNIATNRNPTPADIVSPSIGTTRLVSIVGGAGPDGFGTYCQSHPCSSPLDFSGTLLYNLSPNVLYSVIITVTAATGDDLGSGLVGSTVQSAEASLDPHIYVDPNFNDPDLTFMISDGLENVVGSAATPLPATLPLFASGLGALGLLGWRRQKKVPAPAG